MHAAGFAGLAQPMGGAMRIWVVALCLIAFFGLAACAGDPGPVRNQPGATVSWCDWPLDARGRCHVYHGV